jgi:hypothetical protein
MLSFLLANKAGKSLNFYKAMKTKIFSLFILLFTATMLCAQLPADDNAWIEKAKRVAEKEKLTPKNIAQNAPQKPKSTADEYAAAAPKSTLSLVRPSEELVANAAANNPAPQKKQSSNGNSGDKKQNKQGNTTSANGGTQNKAAANTASKPAPKPAEPKSNIKWNESSSGNFNIRIEPRKTGITTPNLAMKFETIHQILRKNISWMMGGKTDVYVYQSRGSFLHNEPVTSNWAGAFFSPSDNRIVMYDEPNNINRMIQQFSHELTHLFVENFFNPSTRPQRLEPPVWLNEGLAVNMEDISIDTKGGVWASDLVVINIFSAGDKLAVAGMRKGGEKPSIKDRNILSTKVVFLKPFSEFIRNNSYDIAAQRGDVENWYFQAYAMVRFLFRPYNAAYPEKRMQFEQFTKLVSSFEEKRDAGGNIVKDEHGRTVMQRVSCEAALKKAYGFRDIKDFETKFWTWLKALQKTEREKISRSM